IMELSKEPRGFAGTWVHQLHSGFDADMLQYKGYPEISVTKFGYWWAPARDIVLYWPEWIIIAVLETMRLCLTFLLLVPGYPKNDGIYPICTFGATGYIDKWLIGEDHIYRYPANK
ncbi:unnamed protein product, partial [Natator depressus]